MQRFIVPQFIDVENRVIGPITVRQFLIFLGAGILVAIAYRLLLFNAFLVFTIFVGGLAALFAFAKINGALFHFFLLNFIQTIKRPRTRVWNNQANMTDIKSESNLIIDQDLPAPKTVYKKSRLAELSLIVDTKGRYRGES